MSSKILKCKTFHKRKGNSFFYTVQHIIQNYFNHCLSSYKIEVAISSTGIHVVIVVQGKTNGKMAWVVAFFEEERQKCR